MEKVTCRLTIFEGPDGGGKTNIAKAFARVTNARYIHFGPFMHVRDLGRLYVEAMIPALLGLQDVVFDRSWLSELPYGVAYRDGNSRLSSVDIRMLERLAMRCGAVVVRCQPSWPVVLANFQARRGAEMLDSEYQLRTVYDIYSVQVTSLPMVRYDYTQATNGPFEPISLSNAIRDLRHPLHPLDLVSAGNLDGEYVFIGPSLGPHYATDPMYQWPFATFNEDGSGQHLARQLDEVGISEDKILWLDQDQDLSILLDVPAAKIIAVGERAARELRTAKYKVHTTIDHPKHWRRFIHDPAYMFSALLGDTQ